MMQSDLDIQPSYFGFIDTRDNAVKLVQACGPGHLHFVHKRPTSSQRHSLSQSGHVFIYEKSASSIQRWTDGRHWSPSRVLGEFLIYAERLASGTQPHPTETDIHTFGRRWSR
jgi:hypothetical protein